jgi:hypothetical protein
MGKPFVPPTNELTWNAIKSSVAKFKPVIAIEDYVDFDAPKAVEALDYPSLGVNFVLARSKRDEFLGLLRSSQTESGKKGFVEGRWQGALHAVEGAAKDLLYSVTGRTSDDPWALNISFKATKGIGFRQIWYLELTDRQLRLQNARPFRDPTPVLDSKFTDMFEAPNSIDLSALHWAICDADPKTGRSDCNVHIDQVGVTANINGTEAITPDLVYHTLVELAFRTGLNGYLPGPALQAIDFILPSSHENYALNFGAQVTVINRKDLKLSFRGMCSVHENGCEWSGTVNLVGTHNLLGNK